MEAALTSWDEHNFYELLEIPIDASAQAIQEAFRRAKSTYTQDNPALYSMFSKEEAIQLLKLIEEAYTVLSNPVSRRNYDANLKQQQTRDIKSAPSVIPIVTKTKEPVDEVYAIPPAEDLQWQSPRVSHPNSQEEKSNSDNTKSNLHRLKSVPKVKAGQGSTLFGAFKIDQHFENEINEANVINGAFLRRIRDYKKVSIDQIADLSKISSRHLLAIENDELQSLPAPVFLRGFLVQYARALGLDTNHVVKAYMAFYKSKIGKQ